MTKQYWPTFHAGPMRNCVGFFVVVVCFLNMFLSILERGRGERNIVLLIPTVP